MSYHEVPQIARYVEGDSPDTSSEKTKEKKSIITAEQLRGLVAEADKFLESRRGVFQSFSKDVSLTFKPGIDGFFIDLKKGEVHLDMRWFAEKGYTMTQILWACLHELQHFCDLKSDPQTMMDHFDYINGKGPARRAYDTFYNIFDDIFVNRGVERKAPAFTHGSNGGQEIETLYRTKLFPGTDYQEIPRHLQFIYILLRRIMVPGEEVTVSDEVVEILNQPIMIMGKKFTVGQFIDSFMVPTASSFKKESNLPRRRYDLLKRYVEPLFTKLLEIDRNDPRFKRNKNKESGEGEPSEGASDVFDDFYDKFDDLSPDQINPEDIKTWIRHEKEKDDAKNADDAKITADEKKTPGEKAKEARGKGDDNFARKHEIPTSEMRSFRKLEEKIMPYLDELSELWRSIIYGSSTDTKVVLEGYYRAGVDLSIPAVVSAWPEIVSGKMDETRVYVKPVEKSIMRERPELIRVHLVTDLSGSMDDKKRDVLKKASLLLLRSLEEFQTYLNMTRDLTKSNLNVDTELIGFGSHFQVLKPFNSAIDVDAEDVRAQLIKSIGTLNENFGGTEDHLALSHIAHELEGEDDLLVKMKDGKVLELVIEVTDGGSGNPGKAIAAINKLDDLTDGTIITHAIQIGVVSDDESMIFKEVWGDRGVAIGQDISQLPHAVAAILAAYLGKIKL